MTYTQMMPVAGCPRVVEEGSKPDDRHVLMNVRFQMQMAAESDVEADPKKAPRDGNASREEIASEFFMTCWECKRGEYSAQKPHRQRCRDQWAHRGVDWREDPRETGSANTCGRARVDAAMDEEEEDAYRKPRLGGCREERKAQRQLRVAQRGARGDGDPPVPRRPLEYMCIYIGGKGMF